MLKPIVDVVAGQDDEIGASWRTHSIADSRSRSGVPQAHVKVCQVGDAQRSVGLGPQIFDRDIRKRGDRFWVHHNHSAAPNLPMRFRRGHKQFASREPTPRHDMACRSENDGGPGGRCVADSWRSQDSDIAPKDNDPHGESQPGMGAPEDLRRRTN